MRCKGKAIIVTGASSVSDVLQPGSLPWKEAASSPPHGGWIGWKN